jgi:hypothetical protein
MLSAARLILGASLFRAESRLSHFREDFPHRDDASWLVWVDATKSGADQRFAKTAVPTPLCPAVSATVLCACPSRRGCRLIRTRPQLQRDVAREPSGDISKLHWRRRSQNDEPKEGQLRRRIGLSIILR